jgi:hypothetical protein
LFTGQFTDVLNLSHVSPFVFTQQLLPLLKKTAEEPNSDVRIVNVKTHFFLTFKPGILMLNRQVSSDAHFFVPKDTHFRELGDLNRKYTNSLYPALQRYSQ